MHWEGKSGKRRKPGHRIVLDFVLLLRVEATMRIAPVAFFHPSVWILSCDRFLFFYHHCSLSQRSHVVTPP